MAAPHANMAAAYPEPPRPILLVGDPGSGIEYVAGLLQHRPDVLFAADAFAEDSTIRCAAVARLAAQDVAAANLPRSGFAVPDLGRNFIQTLTQLCREASLSVQAIVLRLSVAEADANDWFVDAVRGCLHRMAMITVWRPPVWSAAQAAWGQRSLASQRRVFLDAAAVIHASRDRPSRQMKSTAFPGAKLSWDVEAAWAAYRGQQGRPQELLEFLDLPPAKTAPGRLRPPLSGPLGRWVANTPELGELRWTASTG